MSDFEDHLKELSKNPEFQAALLKRLADSRAKTEELKKAREVKWVCTCHQDDFCILHTRFI